MLAMTREHRDKVLSIAPRLLRRTFTLAEAALIASHPDATSVEDFAGLRPQVSGQHVADVPDPIGQDTQVFVEVGETISRLLAPILELCRRSAAS